MACVLIGISHYKYFSLSLPLTKSIFIVSSSVGLHLRDSQDPVHHNPTYDLQNFSEVM